MTAKLTEQPVLEAMNLQQQQQEHLRTIYANLS